MFCRKCGNEIPDDSIFCLKCGTKIEVIENEVQKAAGEKEQPVVVEEELIVINDGNSINTEPTDTTASTLDIKIMYGIFGTLAVLFLIAIIASSASESAKKCTFGSCDEYKVEGSDYCEGHTCKEDGCYSSKSNYDSYCSTHEAEHACAYSGCESYKVDGGEYCYSHTCSKSGCYNKKGYDSDYCTKHQVNMREKLSMKYLHFSLNSAGGIRLTFKAKNISGNEIKYVRFKVYLKNAVGDSVEDEIKGTSYVDVEIIGPVKNQNTVSMSEEIIGYCDTCARIDINDVTLVYTDGTTETGALNYYAD